MNVPLEYYPLLTVRRMYYVISFDALNNRNPRLCSHYVISDEGVMQCMSMFFAILNAKLMFAFSFTFSINMFSNIFAL